MDGPQAAPAAEWWGQFTDAERDEWRDKVGRFMVGKNGEEVRIRGKRTERRDSDIAKDAYDHTVTHVH